MSIDIAVGIYGGLSLVAAILQGKYKNIPGGSAILMGFGGVLMIAAIFLSGWMAIGTLTVGVIMAHVSAIINGVKMHGEINKTHHFARFLLSVILIVAMYFYQVGL